MNFLIEIGFLMHELSWLTINQNLKYYEKNNSSFNFSTTLGESQL